MGADARQYCGSPLARFDMGSCGDLRFLSFGTGFVSGTFYFGRAGTMVAADTASDDIDAQCLGRQFYGQPVRCEPKPEKNLCPPPQPR